VGVGVGGMVDHSKGSKNVPVTVDRSILLCTRSPYTRHLDPNSTEQAAALGNKDRNKSSLGYAMSRVSFATPTACLAATTTTTPNHTSMAAHLVLFDTLRRC